MGFTPRTIGHASFAQLGHVPMFFVTAGAGVDPTVFGGAVVSVALLEDAGALPFYRVTMPERFRNGTYTLEADCELLDITDDMTVGVGEFTASPANPRTDFQFDVIIRDGGTPTVVTGRRVSIDIRIKS